MISAFRNTFAGLVVLAACIPAAQAQVNGKNQGYLVTDPNFDVVTAVGGTVCVRTSDWTPARAAAAEACKQCTPDLCPKPPAPPARGETRAEARAEARGETGRETETRDSKRRTQDRVAGHRVQQDRDDRRQQEGTRRVPGQGSQAADDGRRGDHHRTHRPHRQRQIQQDAVGKTRTRRQGLCRRQRHRPEADFLGRQRPETADPGHQVLREQDEARAVDRVPGAESPRHGRSGRHPDCCT